MSESALKDYDEAPAMVIEEQQLPEKALECI